MRFTPSHRWTLCACLAFAAWVSGCAIQGPGDVPRPAKQAEFELAPDHVPPLGSCRIWYVELPAYVQPPAMSCGRAHSLAQQHGGRVVAAISQKSFQNGRTMAMDYGPGRFANVPPDNLPPPGYCRAWHDRTPDWKQPPSMPCTQAEQLVRDRGGRLLYMPGPELK
jgi:hypothetical protein